MRLASFGETEERSDERSQFEVEGLRCKCVKGIGTGVAADPDE
jgi:hypothetical protein